MSKQSFGLILLLMVTLSGILGCGGDSTETQSPREAQVNVELQKIYDQINANNQAIITLEIRLQNLEDNFNNNMGQIKADIAKFKQNNQALLVATAGVKPGETPAPAEPSKGVLPGWLEFIIILVIIVAALLLLLYLLRPKPVEDEDFEDFEDMEDFEMGDEAEGDKAAGEGDEDKK